MIDDSFNDTVSIKQNLEGMIKKDNDDQTTSKSNTINNNSQYLNNALSNQTNIKEINNQKINENSNPKKNVTIAEQTNIISNSKSANNIEIDKNEQSDSKMNLNRQNSSAQDSKSNQYGMNKQPSIVSNLNVKFDEDKFTSMINDIEQVLLLINRGKPVTEESLKEIAEKLDEHTDSETKSAINLALQTQKLLK